MTPSAFSFFWGVTRSSAGAAEWVKKDSAKFPDLITDDAAAKEAFKQEHGIK